MMIHDNDQLARSARLLRWATFAGIALIAVGAAFGIWSLLTGQRAEGVLTVSVDSGGLAPVPAALVLALAAGLLLLALLQIAAMLRAVERGAPFRTGARLRGFALYLFLSLLSTMLLPPLIQWFQALAGAPGRVFLSLSSEELLMLFVTGLLFFVGRLLEAAQRVDDDLRQIV